jgi:erythromycin esterase-like protein
MTEKGVRVRARVPDLRSLQPAYEDTRVMYYGPAESWNLRDRHMFETLEAQLDFHGPQARAVVWEHNSHVGNAAATEMSARGALNVGQLCRERFGEQAFLLGFGTDHGTVAAAHDWDAPMQVRRCDPLTPRATRGYSTRRACRPCC